MAVIREIRKKRGRPAFDPGLGQRAGVNGGRVVLPDGTFNVERKSLSYELKDTYQYLITIGWGHFFIWLFTGYLFANTCFALIYLAIGVEHLAGADLESAGTRFLSAFFFSAQTLTTVGYGGIHPAGWVTSGIAAVEAMIGVLGFALATGLLYGRFSHPQMKILFSRNVLISPYNEGEALMFRIANQRSNNILNASVKVLLVFSEKAESGFTRRYYPLNLERESVTFFPLSWTVVHPIDAESPFFGLSESEITENRCEIIVQVSGYDDTFHQETHRLSSYTAGDFVWNAKFLPAFSTLEDGRTVFNLDHLHLYQNI